MSSSANLQFSKELMAFIDKLKSLQWLIWNEPNGPDWKPSHPILFYLIQYLLENWTLIYTFLFNFSSDAHFSTSLMKIHTESMSVIVIGTISAYLNYNGASTKCQLSNVLYEPNSRRHLLFVKNIDMAGMSIIFSDWMVKQKYCKTKI